MTNPNISELLKSLEANYTNKEYQQAIDALLKSKKELDPGLFHYNLGTFYAKKGDLAIGRYHLEKSYKIGFINGASQNNIKAVVEKLGVQDITTSSSRVERMIDSSLNFPSQAYFGLTCFFLILILLMVRFKKIGKSASIFMGIVAFLPTLYFFIFLNNLNHAVALSPVAVFEGPSKVFEKKLDLPAGAKIIFNKRNDDWIFIRYPLFLSGWVNKESMGIF